MGKARELEGGSGISGQPMPERVGGNEEDAGERNLPAARRSKEATPCEPGEPKA